MLGYVHCSPVKILRVSSLAHDLLLIIVRDILATCSHLALHEALSSGESLVPCLKLCKYCVNARVFYVAAERALDVQSPVLLVKFCFKQLVLQAQDDLVLELADIIQIQSLHELIVGYNCLLRCDVRNCDKLELFDLGRLEGQVARLTSLILDNRAVGEKIQRLQVLRLRTELFDKKAGY